MKKYTNIIFNNNNSLDLGLLVASTIDIPSPNKLESNLSSIPNRESLTPANDVYEDIEIVVKFNFDLDKVNIREVKKWLRVIDDNTLRLSSDSDYIYRVKKVVHTPIKTYIIGEFDVTFTVSGLRYLDSSLEVINISNNSTIYNDGDCISNPVFLIHGAGVVTLNVNDTQVTINISDSAIINSDLKLCYRDNGSLINQTMSGVYPKLLPGNNNISWSGTVTSCKLITNFKYI